MCERLMHGHAGPARIRKNRVHTLPDQGFDENVGPGDERVSVGFRFQFRLRFFGSHVGLALCFLWWGVSGRIWR